MKNENTLPGEGAADIPLPGKRSRPHRILVVDDESGVRAVMAAALSGSGYHVDTAEDGAVAWDALQAIPYDLLITDHHMPNVTGVELVKKVRSARMALPVVMVTGELPEHEIARNPSLQFAATMLKPLLLEDLLSTVTSVLRATE